MVRFLSCYEPPAVSGTGGCTELAFRQLNPMTALAPPFSLSLAFIESLRRPVLEARAERQPARSQHFLDLVERLAAEVRRLQQLGLGALDQVTDVVDVLGLQAIRRTHGELELVDRTKQDRIELRASRPVSYTHLRAHETVLDL